MIFLIKRNFVIDMKKKSFSALVILLLWYFCILAFDVASFASSTTDSDGLSSVLCLIVSKLQGPIGMSVSAIALFALGFKAMTHKLEWPAALGVAIGITFIFSAGKIINWLMGQNIAGC